MQSERIKHDEQEEVEKMKMTTIVVFLAKKTKKSINRLLFIRFATAMLWLPPQCYSARFLTTIIVALIEPMMTRFVRVKVTCETLVRSTAWRTIWFKRERERKNVSFHSLASIILFDINDHQPTTTTTIIDDHYRRHIAVTLRVPGIVVSPSLNKLVYFATFFCPKLHSFCAATFALVKVMISPLNEHISISKDKIGSSKNIPSNWTLSTSPSQY